MSGMAHFDRNVGLSGGAISLEISAIPGDPTEGKELVTGARNVLCGSQ